MLVVRLWASTAALNTQSLDGHWFAKRAAAAALEAVAAVAVGGDAAQQQDVDMAWDVLESQVRMRSRFLTHRAYGKEHQSARGVPCLG